MAIQQTTPEVARTDRIELEAPTETELCARGAVKLTHMELARLRTANGTVEAELRTERQRTEALNSRAISAEAQCGVLRDTLRLAGRREIIMRLIEVAIVVLLAYAIDFAKSKSWNNFVVFIVLSLILGLAIALIQWWTHPSERK